MANLLPLEPGETIRTVLALPEDEAEWSQLHVMFATAKGLVATFTDQALQDPSVRPEVAETLGIWGKPQVLLRVGRALVEAPSTPRRALEELFS